MGKHILSAAEFFLNEGTINDPSDWPDNWKDMPEWTQLQELGFTDATTPQMAKNGSILLMNFAIPHYPGGITLQQSGYIRNKLASSGFIKNYRDSFTLKQMFDYLIEKFTKLSKKGIERNPEHGDLPDPTVAFLNKVVNGSWSFNQETQRIDVEGNVNMSMIKSIPEGIRFGNVLVHFVCNNMGLTNLDIAPIYVGGYFDCSSNKLTSLEGGPERVDGNYDCSLNKLTTLRGAPEYCAHSFVCSSNKLETLEGCPKEVGRRFDCSKNPLKSLIGSPEMNPESQFFADRTLINNLSGMPEVGEVTIEACKNLKSLRDLPQSVYSIYQGGMSIFINKGGNRSGGNFSRSYILEAIAQLISYRNEAITSDRYSNTQIPDIERGGYTIHTNIYNWNSTPKERERGFTLFMTLLDNDFLDQYFKENPMDINILNALPDVKAGVLQRTGIKDYSKLAAALRSGMV